MLGALTALVAAQLFGEIVARTLGLPVPGPVLGLLSFLTVLAIRARRGNAAVGPDLRQVSNGLLANLGLLFVPAGVGIVTQLDVLTQNWLAVAVAIVVSTVAGLVVTGWVMQRLSRDGEAGTGR